MEDHPTVVTNNIARKRKRNPENWARNRAMELRYSVKSLPDRVCNHNSKALQCVTLSMTQLKELQDFFYKQIFDTQETLTANEIQENYCEGTMEQVRDLRI